jgi:hypothetical protein
MLPRFVLTSRGNPGDLNPLLTAACQLREQGPGVRIVGEAAHQETTVQAGFDEFSWWPAPPGGSGKDHTRAEICVRFKQIMFGPAPDPMDALCRGRQG